MNGIVEDRDKTYHMAELKEDTTGKTGGWFITVKDDLAESLRPPLCQAALKPCDKNIRQCVEEMYSYGGSTTYPSHSAEWLSTMYLKGIDLKQGLQGNEGRKQFIAGKECNEIICLEKPAEPTDGYYKQKGRSYQALLSCGESKIGGTLWYHPIEKSIASRLKKI